MHRANEKLLSSYLINLIGELWRVRLGHVDSNVRYSWVVEFRCVVLGCTAVNPDHWRGLVHCGLQLPFDPLGLLGFSTVKDYEDVTFGKWAFDRWLRPYLLALYISPVIPNRANAN